MRKLPRLHIPKEVIYEAGSASLATMVVNELRERFLTGCIIERLTHVGRIRPEEVIGIETGHILPHNCAQILYHFPDHHKELLPCAPSEP